MDRRKDKGFEAYAASSSVGKRQEVQYNNQVVSALSETPKQKDTGDDNKQNETVI